MKRQYLHTCKYRSYIPQVLDADRSNDATIESSWQNLPLKFPFLKCCKLCKNSNE